MVDVADITPGDRVREPSAGTGAIRKALPTRVYKVAVKINPKLVDALACGYGSGREFTRQTSALQDELGTFDQSLINPPFKDGVDISHIMHAVKFLTRTSPCGNLRRRDASAAPVG